MGNWRRTNGGIYVLDKLEGVRPTTSATSTTPLWSAVLPANSMGPNGILRLTYAYSCDTVAGFTYIISMGGANIKWDTMANATSYQIRNLMTVGNQNDPAVQYFTSVSSSFLEYGQIANVAQNLAVDTTVDVDIDFKGYTATGAEVLTLEEAMIEVIPG